MRGNANWMSVAGSSSACTIEVSRSSRTRLSSSCGNVGRSATSAMMGSASDKRATGTCRSTYDASAPLDVERLARVPLGFGGTSDMGVQIDGYTPAPNEEMQVYYNRVSSDYLKTLGIRLIDGREFTDRDVNGTPDVAIVNETLVR